MIIEDDVARFGFEVKKYKFRRDLKSVNYRGFQVTNVPTRLRRWSNPLNKVPGLSMLYPNYHEMMFSIRQKWVLAKFHDFYLRSITEAAKQKFDPQYDEE